MALTATVLGASGYSGSEMLRLLSNHAAIEVVCASGHGRAGEAVTDVLPHLPALAGTRFVGVAEAVATAGDVCFCCLPAETAAEVAGDIAADVVIDLSDAFRGSEGWTYGLSEFARADIQVASRIANPGCYPTAVLLAVVPFARQRAIEGPVSVDGMSGTSGAGRRAEDRLLHASVDGSVAAYGELPHRHVAEMEAGLWRFGTVTTEVSFLPHLVPMSRGLSITARAPLTTTLTDGEAMEVLRSAYRDEPFVHAVDRWPTTKAVNGSNHVQVSARVDARGGMLVCVAALDNLVKGAAGQALQNANLALGLEETTGLEGSGLWP